MKTLSELIADGLPVGALVECVIEERYMGEHPLYFTSIWQYNGECLVCVSRDCNLFEIGDTVFDSYSPSVFQPTTAYDSDIDPETLPIPEPFWIGWVVCDGVKFPVLKIVEGEYWPPQGFDDEGYQEPNYIKFKDGFGRYQYDCQPCLPPN